MNLIILLTLYVMTAGILERYLPLVTGDCIQNFVVRIDYPELSCIRHPPSHEASADTVWHLV